MDYLAELKIRLYKKLLEKLEKEMSTSEMLMLCALSSDEEMIKEIMENNKEFDVDIKSLWNHPVKLKDTSLGLVKKC